MKLAQSIIIKIALLSGLLVAVLMAYAYLSAQNTNRDTAAKVRSVERTTGTTTLKSPPACSKNTVCMYASYYHLRGISEGWYVFDYATGTLPVTKSTTTSEVPILGRHCEENSAYHDCDLPPIDISK